MAQPPYLTWLIASCTALSSALFRFYFFSQSAATFLYACSAVASSAAVWSTLTQLLSAFILAIRPSR